jgi:hypothetical protein
MRLHKTFIFVCCSLMLVSFNAAAIGITKNGTYYTLWFNDNCRDGTRGITYLNQYWCPTYQAKLTWSIPTTRQNGQALKMSDLRGYEVYWGRSIDARTGTIKVNGGGVATTTFEAQTPATYYFVVSAIDSNGVKSPLSKMVETKLGRR